MVETGFYKDGGLRSIEELENHDYDHGGEITVLDNLKGRLC